MLVVFSSDNICLCITEITFFFWIVLVVFLRAWKQRIREVLGFGEEVSDLALYQVSWFQSSFLFYFFSKCPLFLTATNRPCRMHWNSSTIFSIGGFVRVLHSSGRHCQSKTTTTSRTNHHSEFRFVASSKSIVKSVLASIDGFRLVVEFPTSDWWS